jgi:hypothetical protein
MADKKLELEVAVERRKFWSDKAEQARASSNFGEAAVAQRFLAEYDDLVSQLRTQQSAPD